MHIIHKFRYISRGITVPVILSFSSLFAHFAFVLYIIYNTKCLQGAYTMYHKGPN